MKIPERQKNTQQRQSIVKKKQKNAIIGNGDADLNFAGAARRIWLHLGRVGTSYHQSGSRRQVS